MYSTYIILCPDSSLYTGITTDLKRRLREHQESAKGAKYMWRFGLSARKKVRLVYFKEWPDRSTASIEEARIKKLSRLEKIAFIAAWRKEYLSDLRKKKKVGRESYLDKKEEARKIITKRVLAINKKYDFVIGGIAIRDTKTRWGSCSKKGNLNFNYRIAFMESEVMDYVIVHELCHLKEFNHSKKFWELVAELCPSHKETRKKLKKRVL